jgi:hypothetical protein
MCQKHIPHINSQNIFALRRHLKDDYILGLDYRYQHHKILVMKQNITDFKIHMLCFLEILDVS